MFGFLKKNKELELIKEKKFQKELWSNKYCFTMYGPPLLNKEED